MTSSEQDAEDITQETFIKIIKSLPSFEGRSQISTWIYRIAMNESLMNLRRRKPLSGSVEIDRETGDDQDEEIQIVDWAGQPEAELITSEAKQELDSAISRLPEGLRSVFILRDLQDLSIEDTSGILGISTANVKTRLLRARLEITPGSECLLPGKSYKGNRIMNQTPECQRLIGELSNLIDGTISPELCAELEAHLKECKNCRIVVDTTKKTIELYHRDEASVEVPEVMREKLWKRLDLGDFTQ